MGKKEFPKINLKPKAAGFGGYVFAFLKLILGVCLLAFVYSVSAAFLNEFNQLELPLQKYFWLGAITLLVIYLFIWEPAIIYAKGQRILELFFSFFKPLVRVAPYLLPVYTVIFFIVYLIASAALKMPPDYFMFLFGFSIALHLIFSAKSLRLKQQDLLKSNYIFGFSFIYIINLTLLAFLLNVIFSKFSFVNFCNYSFQVAKGIFSAVFRQLFLPSPH